MSAKTTVAVSMSAAREVERQIYHLRYLIDLKGLTQQEIAERLEWSESKLSRTLKATSRILVEEVLAILEVVGVPPADFFRLVYTPRPEDDPEAAPTLAGLATAPLALDLAAAAKKLGDFPALTPGTPQFAHLYVKRPSRPLASLARALEMTPRRRQPLRWLVSGQPDAGTSTELRRLLRTPSVEDHFLPCRVGLRDLPPGAGPGVLLASSLAAAARLADSVGVEHPDAEDLAHAIREPAAFPPRRLIRLLESVAGVFRRRSGRSLLLVVEGLERRPRRTCFRFLDHHLDTLLRPAVSQVVVVPFFLLATRLAPRLESRTTIVPPIAADDRLAFYEHLVSRYLPLKLISVEARRELCRLSAGLVGEMLMLTRQACLVARQRIDVEHVEEVVARRGRSWASRLQARDLDTLRDLLADPFRRDSPDLPRLVAMRALVAEPRDEGLAYVVHPTLRRFLEGEEK